MPQPGHSVLKMDLVKQRGGSFKLKKDKLAFSELLNVKRNERQKIANKRKKSTLLINPSIFKLTVAISTNKNLFIIFNFFANMVKTSNFFA
jgi:hypothetical protein